VLNFGGVETYTVRLARALVELGHESAVLTLGGPVATHLAESGADMIQVPSLRRGDLAGVADALRDRRFDVIHGQNYRSGRIGWRIARRLGLPWVFTVHGPRAWALRMVVRYWGDPVVTVSEGDKATITGFLGVPPERVHVSFVPVDERLYHPQAPSERAESGPLIVHVSRWAKRKSVPPRELLRGSPAILRRWPNARLLLVGHGPGTARVREAIERLNADHPGAARLEAPRLNLAPIFRSADVVVATATTALEALACGTPVVAAGRTGYVGPVSSAAFPAAQAVLFGDHGQCARPVRAEYLVDGIAEVLGDADRWRAETAALADEIASRFTTKDAAADMVGVYERVLARARAVTTRS
jgi:glycosyltransferase involved in cell wall biosynthesis